MSKRPNGGNGLVEPKPEVPEDWAMHNSALTALAKAFGKHLGRLAVVFEQENETRFPVYTGFFVRHDRELYWFTAGHCLEQIEAMQHDQSVKLGPVAMFEGTGSDTYIPLHLENLEIRYLNEGFMDLGFIRFRPYYADQILALSNVEPLAEEIWIGAQAAIARADRLVLVGTPQTMVGINEVPGEGAAKRYRFQFPTIVVPVDQTPMIEKRELDGFGGHPEAIYGKVGQIEYDNGAKLDDIKGMSGGMVFSVERVREVDICYHLQGVQSSWLPKSRIARITPVGLIPAMLEVSAAERSMAE